MKTERYRQPVKVTAARSLDLAVNGVQDYAIYMLDPRGYVVSWNTAAQGFKGYGANELAGKHFSAFYTAEDRASGLPERTLRTALDEGKFEGEGWRLQKDGARFLASVIIEPIWDALGEPVGFAKIMRELGADKAAQEALLATEAQFRVLVEGVTDYAIYMLSPSGTVTSWNAGAKRIKGYEQDEIVGRHFGCFYTEEDRVNAAPARTLEVAARDGRMEMEGWRVRKDGSRFWAHVVVDAIQDNSGALIGFAKITQDITERKEAAEALHRANVALFQSQKMEAIGQLTGGVAHDFNNLLSVLANGLQALSAQSQTPFDAKMLEMMRRAVDRGASLSQQLLAFARQQPLKPERIDLNTLIRGFEPMLRAGIGAISIEIALNSRQSTVLLDAVRFEAALLNLVVNARDAMPDGGSILISTEDVELGAGTIGALAGGPYIKLSVKDSGIGMPPEITSRAFEPFFSTKEAGKGTGLGLSQVYGFITQSGGDVQIKSSIGNGTTIDIYLPTATGNTEPPR